MIKKPLKIHIVDINKPLIKAMKEEFAPYLVKVSEGSIFDYDADAVISPANSFGHMDGGLDGKLRDYFGMQIEINAQKKIRDDYHGELLVGQATVIESGNQKTPFIIVAPTMRVPSNVSDSINAYLAMRAILRTALAHKMINNIVVSGLCSLSGLMQPHIVARQMRAAYEYVINDQHHFPHWRLERDFEDYLRGKTNLIP